MICFLSHDDAGEWGVKADPLLRKIVREADELLHQYGHHATVTSFIRRRTTDSGVHETGRAVDLRTHGLDISALRTVESQINSAYPRGDDKPSIIYHDVGRGPHYHIQVEPVERRYGRAVI